MYHIPEFESVYLDAVIRLSSRDAEISEVTSRVCIGCFTNALAMTNSEELIQHHLSTCLRSDHTYPQRHSSACLPGPNPYDALFRVLYPRNSSAAKSPRLHEHETPREQNWHTKLEKSAMKLQ